MEPFEKNMLIDGAVKFCTTRKNIKIQENNNRGTNDDLKKDVEEVDEVKVEETEVEETEVEEVEEVIEVEVEEVEVEEVIEVEVQEEEIYSVEKFYFKEFVNNMYREVQKLFIAVNYQTLTKLLSRVTSKTTPWLQRLNSETQDAIKLMNSTTSIQNFKLQQRSRPVNSKIKRLYDRNRR